jgi:hypothetical protein
MNPRTTARVLLGILAVPVLPFVSAVLWRAGRNVLGIAILLTLAGYIVFFYVAIGWGFILVASASVWSMGGTAVARWRRCAPKA